MRWFPTIAGFRHGKERNADRGVKLSFVAFALQLTRNPFAKAREQTPYEDLTHVEQQGFRAEAPEMMDILDGTEQLVSVISNPIYTRKVSLPRNG